MAMATILASMPDLWQRTLAEHVRDPYGRCAACRDSSGSAHWPCLAWELAQQARAINERGMAGSWSRGAHSI